VKGKIAFLQTVSANQDIIRLEIILITIVLKEDVTIFVRFATTPPKNALSVRAEIPEMPQKDVPAQKDFMRSN
jgi:hypothetical protein